MEVAAELPRYYKANKDHPNRLSIAENFSLLEKLQLHYAAKNNILFINREDGLIVYFTNRSRVQIRCSNTESRCCGCVRKPRSAPRRTRWCKKRWI